MSLTGKFVQMAQHFILLGLNPFDLSLGFLERAGGFCPLCQKCGVFCQQRVLKKFPDSGHLHSKDQVV